MIFRISRKRALFFARVRKLAYSHASQETLLENPEFGVEEVQTTVVTNLQAAQTALTTLSHQLTSSRPQDSLATQRLSNAQTAPVNSDIQNLHDQIENMLTELNDPSEVPTTSTTRRP